MGELGALGLRPFLPLAAERGLRHGRPIEHPIEYRPAGRPARSGNRRRGRLHGPVQLVDVGPQLVGRCAGPGRGRVNEHPDDQPTDDERTAR